MLVKARIKAIRSAVRIQFDEHTLPEVHVKGCEAGHKQRSLRSL
jgi:hypothetical protein